MANQPSRLTPGTNGDVLLFARNFFRHPRMLGSIVPSSRFLIKQLLEPINWARARVIVEYGPGVGGITVEVLRRMRADATLIAIEMNPEFVSYLSNSIPDARLKVVEGSAEQVDEILRRFGYTRADYIISGIPFSTIPAPVRERILRTHLRGAGARRRVPGLPVLDPRAARPEARVRLRRPQVRTPERAAGAPVHLPAVHRLRPPPHGAPRSARSSSSPK